MEETGGVSCWSAVTSYTGERTVVSANAHAFPPLTFEVDPDWLNHKSIVLVDGHYMRMCIMAAQYAHSRGIPVVLESGSWKEGMAGLLPHVDIAICSDDFRPPDCQDDTEVLEFLAGQGISRLAITRGSAPISYVEALPFLHLASLWVAEPLIPRTISISKWQQR